MSKILLVEGNDDLHVVLALLQKFNISETFRIVDCKGIEPLIISLPVRLKEAGVEKIAIIVDADQNISSRWQQLGDALKLLVENFPQSPDIDGTQLKTLNNQEIMIWLMPNNKISGMLEDFISFLIPRDDVLKPLAEKALTEIETAGLNKYSPIHHTKALIHTWLAWQEDPGVPMGLSITKRYLTTDEETCIRFVNWLARI